MATSVQTLKDLGEQMGLKGTDLKDFIKEQQELERDERNKQREYDKEKELREFEKAKLEADKVQIAAVEQDKQREFEKEKQIKQLEYETEQREHEYRMAKEKQDYEERKHQREMADRARQVEIERMQCEQKKLEKEMQEIESGRHFMADTENDETGISDIGKITWMHFCTDLRYTLKLKVGRRIDGQFIYQLC